MSIGGYAGKILFVDLTNGTFSDLNTSDYTDYIGGKGMALRLQWEFGNPEVKDGFDPRSLLMFMTGPLSGTPSPTSGRMVVCYKQVANDPKCWWSHSGTGGWFGPEMKFAGYDGIVLQGKSPTPVYLWINDGTVELRDATAYWDKDTYTTQDSIRAELGGDTKIRMGVIGQAGSNKSKSACILFDVSHAAGQNCGGIMGSKNLKAVAVRGTQGIKIADPEAILAIRDWHSNTLLPVKISHGYSCFGCSYPCHTYATAGKGPRGGNFCGWANSYNWSRVAYLGDSELKKTAYGDYYLDPMLYTSTYNPQSKVSTEEPEIIPEFSKLMDYYGIAGYDMIGMRTAGNWIMALSHDPIMEGKFMDFLVAETGGAPGSTTYAQNVPRLTALKLGKFGKLMADGVLFAAMELRDNYAEYGLTAKQGQFAWECYERIYPKNYAVEHHFYRPTCANPKWDIRDIEQSPVTEMLVGIGTRDTMSNHHAFHTISDENSHGNSYGHALAALGSGEAGARYLNADGDPIFKNQVDSPEAGKYYTLGLKESTPVVANYTLGTPIALANATALGMQTDSLTFCDWHFPVICGGMFPMELASMGYGLTPYLEANWADPDKVTDVGLGSRLYSAVTGINKTFEQLQEDSFRCVLLERSIQVRDNNRTREDDFFNNVIHNRPDVNGITIDRDVYREGLDLYSEYAGLDVETGTPTRATLEKYGLKDVADKLEAMGRLPA